MKRAWIALAMVGCTICTIAGCTSADAPLDQLSLRDALGARPDAIAALSLDARHALALRFVDAQHQLAVDATAADGATRDETADTRGDSRDTHAVAAAVRAFDSQRAATGQDALVGVGTQDRQRTISALVGTVWIGASAAGLPALEGRDPAGITDAIEQRALAGKAGRVLAGAVADRNAKRLVRVTQWPAAIVASDDTIYVNASWLVAMAAVDDPAKVNPDDDPPLPSGLNPTPYTFCSVADNDESTERRLFWIAGPLLFVVWFGRSWKKRSARG